MAPWVNIATTRCLSIACAAPVDVSVLDKVGDLKTQVLGKHVFGSVPVAGAAVADEDDEFEPHLWRLYLAPNVDVRRYGMGRLV